MVSGYFEGILKELEPFFNCPLPIDQNNACLVKMGIGISVQMELNRYSQLLVGVRLGSIEGAYANQLLVEALKSNARSLPSTGVLGFKKKTRELILFLLLDPAEINKNRVEELLPVFISKAKLWKDAISTSQIPQDQSHILD